MTNTYSWSASQADAPVVAGVGVIVATPRLARHTMTKPTFAPEVYWVLRVYWHWGGGGGGGVRGLLHFALII